MSQYVTLGARDLAQSAAFYDAALATIGWQQFREFPGWRAYSEGGSDEGLTLWICTPFDGQPASAGNGSMLGFMVNTTAEVDAFHAVALQHGGTDEGAPGPRPQYAPGWYAAYVRDPSGNKLGVVCMG